MRFYEESHSGWKARPNLAGGYEILDGNGWAVAVLNYDYRYTCNATNHYRAKMLATAPDLLEYVKSSASAGCATAKAIIARMDAAETEPAPTAGQE